MAEDQEGVRCPSCGEIPDVKYLARHVAKCKGKVPTSGRIAAREPRRADPPRAAVVSRKRSAVQREKRVVRGRQKGRGSLSAVDTTGSISPAAFIAALKAERAKIDAAIAAVEALA